MTRRVTISLITIAVLAAGAYGLLKTASTTATDEYQLAAVIRGDLESTISSTGTLSPVTTVDVGTQVSGTIDSVFVDYNDNVRQGQLLAVLDTSLLKLMVLDAEAGLARAEAQLEQAKSDYNRNDELFQRKMISEAEFLPFKVSLRSQEASVQSAEAALERAQQNLNYAVIRSPINGTVIVRNVEAGQTVASSFSTPTLFRIAEDLSRMQILAEVDESDIGLIKADQQVRFEVQTYSDSTFTGVVTQIRLQPQTISNVVTYTVVIDAANDENLLLPGMTAMVDFVIEQKSGVLLVSNKALRYQPSDEEMQTAFERRRASIDATPDSLRAGSRPRSAGGSRSATNMGRVWYLAEDGQLALAPLRTGMTDGVNTEVVRSRDYGASSTTTSSSGKKQQQGPGFGGPPPRGF